MGELVERVLAVLFPNQAQRISARDGLASYGGEDYQPEHERVRLAILKLSAGDLARLGELVAAACADYRDVLMWAEFPEEMKHAPAALPLGDDPVTKRHIAEVRQRDRQQYEEWLARFSK